MWYVVPSLGAHRNLLWVYCHFPDEASVATLGAEWDVEACDPVSYMIVMPKLDCTLASAIPMLAAGAASGAFPARASLVFRSGFA